MQGTVMAHGGLLLRQMVGDPAIPNMPVANHQAEPLGDHFEPVGIKPETIHSMPMVAKTRHHRMNYQVPLISQQVGAVTNVLVRIDEVLKH